jgi:hypothetical protein
MRSPEQAKNVADNSRAAKGGQMTRYRHAKSQPLSKRSEKGVAFNRGW